MRKYFTLLYITFSVTSFAQLKDNVFDQNNSSTRSSAQTAEANATFGSEDGNETNSSGGYEHRPGNPGPEVVPIDSLIPFLILTGLVIILYFQRKDKNINI